MYKQAALLVLLVVGALAIGPALVEIELWTGEPPLGKPGVSQRGETSPMSRKISGVNVPKLVKLEDEQRRLLGKYAPKNLSVLVIPGGGYDSISSVNEGTEVIEYLNSLGINAYMLLYRHNPYRHPVPLLDAFRGIRLLRKIEAEKLKGDVGSVGILGFSAGGHLAATVLTFADRDPSVYLKVSGAEDSVEGGPSFLGDDLAGKYSCRPDFSILLYPVISMEPGVTHDRTRRNIAGSPFGSPLSTPLDHLMSLEKSVLRETHEYKMRALSPLISPVLIIHSGDDQAVPVENALRFYRALNSMNGRAVNEGSRNTDRIECDVEMRLYSYGNHGFGLYKREKRRPTPAWNGAGGILESWIDRKMPSLSSK